MDEKRELLIEYIWRQETGLEKPEGKHLYPLNGNFDSIDINDWVWLTKGQQMSLSRFKHSGETVVSENLLSLIDLQRRELDGTREKFREYSRRKRTLEKEKKEMNESKGISVTDQD